MPTFALLTRLSSDALSKPESITDLNKKIEERIKKDCPAVKWISNYSVLGPYDYLDIFESPQAEDAMKVALVIRSFGHATTETWMVTPWKAFVQLANESKNN